MPEPLPSPTELDGDEGADELEQELARVETASRELARTNAALGGNVEEGAASSRRGKGKRKKKRARSAPSHSLYRTPDPTAQKERALEDAHARLSDLQIEQAVLKATRDRTLQDKLTRLRTAAVGSVGLLAAALLGAVTQAFAVFVAAAVFFNLALLLYWLIVRIKPTHPDRQPRVLR